MITVSPVYLGYICNMMSSKCRHFSPNIFWLISEKEIYWPKRCGTEAGKMGRVGPKHDGSYYSLQGTPILTWLRAYMVMFFKHRGRSVDFGIDMFRRCIRTWVIVLFKRREMKVFSRFFTEGVFDDLQRTSVNKPGIENSGACSSDSCMTPSAGIQIFTLVSCQPSLVENDEWMFSGSPWYLSRHSTSLAAQKPWRSALSNSFTGITSLMRRSSSANDFILELL